MRTLVLCVDRDDDLGVKARITSPVIGKKNNLRGLIALGLEDPEDSDLNVMLMGLKLYKKYTDLGRTVELATICGDRNVGHQSDANLIKQFYAVLDSFTPDTVVLVSDGAEDEVILPLISQKVQVEHIARVVIKQQQSLENTFYVIKDALKSPKIARNIILPLTSILILWGVLMMLGSIALAFGLVVIILSLLIIYKTMGIEDQIVRMLEDTRTALQTRKYFLFGGAGMAVIVLMIGVVYSYYNTSSINQWGEFFYHFIVHFYSFVLASAALYILGNSLDNFMRTGRFSKISFTLFLSLGAIWFLLSTALDLFGYLLDFLEWDDSSLNPLLTFMILGIALLAASGMSYAYNRMKTKGGKRAGWLR
jgi:putative membrane protein